MTFLELVKRLCVESGIGPGPVTVIGQTGAYAQAVGWVQSAYEEIQNIHPDWQFLRTEASFTTSVWPPVVTDFASWKEDSFRIYLTASGIATEQWLLFCPWEVFRDTYYYGTGRTQTGYPNIVTIKPDHSLLIWPLPDDTYTVVCDYYKQPHTFTANADVPIFPQHHLVIVWKSLMYYGASASEPDKYAFGQEQFRKLEAKLFNQQRPRIMWGPPLA